MYRSLADGTRMLGRAERLLFPGRPRNGTVAILFTQASQVWDPDASAYSYFMDLYGLHAALVHEQYPVDFIDDYGVEAGDLQKYPYQVLYVCGPNLSVKAQRAVAEWVSAGGTLVLLPGAAMADEYNEPTTEFVRSIGLTRDPVPRAVAVLPHQLAESEPVPVAISDDRIGPGTVAAHGQVVAIKRAGIRAFAKLADGSPVVAEFPHGEGRVFLYGYWPGQAYWLSPDRSRYDRLPQDWSAAARRLATAPARLTEARRFVRVDLPGVEACLLESDQGLAIVLLNWTGQPASKIWVTIPEAGRFSKIESLEQGTLKPSSTADDLELGLPLDTVDVLLLTW
ncbi:hypothetical protein HQ590_09115 [bacterium]|nr:hypothetical protein [bacterium]